MQETKCEGYLSKKPDKGLIKKWKSYWVEADMFKLTWHEEKGSAQKGVENLRNITVFTEATSKEADGLFGFELRIGKETHHFAAKTAEERIKWLRYCAQWAPKEANQLKTISLTGAAPAAAAPGKTAGPSAGTTIAVEPGATTVECTQSNLENFPTNVLQMTRVESVDLSENKIPVIPAEISNIGATLVVLNLSYNNISTLPNSLSQLRKLEELHLHKNKITSLPDAIGEISTLQLLSLGENKITSLPASIGKLKQLRRLNVAYNIGIQIPNELAQCTQMYWIDISGNKYRQFPSVFLAFKLLEIFEANNNEFETLPPSFATSFPVLQQLRLAHNKLITLPEDIGTLQGLDELELTFNNLTALPKSLGKSRAFLQVENNALQLPADILSKGSNGIKAYLAGK